MKSRSVIWSYFTDLGDKRLKCNHCNGSISIKGGSVGNLNRHVRKKHPELYLPSSVVKQEDTTVIQTVENDDELHELNEFILIDVKNDERQESVNEKQETPFVKKIRFENIQRNNQQRSEIQEEREKCHSCCKKKLALRESYLEKKLKLMEKKVEILEKSMDLQKKNLELKERIATALETLCC